MWYTIIYEDREDNSYWEVDCSNVARDNLIDRIWELGYRFVGAYYSSILRNAENKRYWR